MGHLAQFERKNVSACSVCLCVCYLQLLKADYFITNSYVHVIILNVPTLQMRPLVIRAFDAVVPVLRSIIKSVAEVRVRVRYFLNFHLYEIKILI